MTSCAEVRDLAPELALGSLDGALRADVLAHIARCPACRAEVRDLADVVDGLSVLAPEVEPPAGFADSVLDAMRAAEPPRPAMPSPRRRWRTRHLVVAAVAAGLLGLGGTAAVVATRHQPATDVALNARTLQTIPMIGAGNQALGEAFVSRGHDPWVLVNVNYGLSGDHYRLVGANATGWIVDIGPLRSLAGRWAWAGRVDQVASFDELRIVDDTGTVVCRAALSTPA